jgi:hypothetical protein
MIGCVNRSDGSEQTRGVSRFRASCPLKRRDDAGNLKGYIKSKERVTQFRQNFPSPILRHLIYYRTFLFGLRGHSKHLVWSHFEQIFWLTNLVSQRWHVYLTLILIGLSTRCTMPVSGSCLSSEIGIKGQVTEGSGPMLSSSALYLSHRSFMRSEGDVRR